MELSPIVDHAYLLNVTPNQHHARDHKARHQKDGADDLESLLCLANFSEKSHASLSNVTAAQHHAKYTNAEAVVAAEAEDPFDHAGAVNIGGKLRVGTQIAPYSQFDIQINDEAVGAIMTFYQGHSTLVAGDFLGSTHWRGRDWGAFEGEVGAMIVAKADDSWALGIQYRAPSRLEFYTQSADAANGLIAPRMTIDNAGNISVATGNLSMAATKTVDGVDISVHAANTNAHHAQSHTLASHSTKAHSELTGVTASQHHVKTVSSDISLAGMAEKSHASLTGVTSDQHHAKYTNAEALAAAEAGSPFIHAGNVDIRPNIMLEGISQYRVYRNLTSYSSNAYEAGAFVIHTNLPVGNQMSRMEVDAYFYDNEVPSKLIICWYTRADFTYNRPGFVNLGPKTLDVRWAREISTGKQAIIIGAEGSTYSLPKMTVSSYMMGYSGLQDSYADGWSITQETSLAGFDNMYTIPEKGIVSSQHGITFNLGLATVGTKQAQALIRGTLRISKVKIYADTAPTGAALVVDVNKNGVTIFTTQANRPQIAIGEHADDSGTPNITSLAEGDRLSVDVDQVGSTTPGGNDLLVTIIC